MFEFKQQDKIWFLWVILDYHIEKNHETTGFGETLRERKKIKSPIKCKACELVYHAKEKGQADKQINHQMMQSLHSK